MEGGQSALHYFLPQFYGSIKYHALLHLCGRLGGGDRGGRRPAGPQSARPWHVRPLPEDPPSAAPRRHAEGGARPQVLGLQAKEEPRPEAGDQAHGHAGSQEPPGQEEEEEDDAEESFRTLK